MEISSTFSKDELVDLFFFRDKMKGVNRLERLKEDNDPGTEHIIFESKNAAFEEYARRLYPKEHLRKAANAIILEEKEHSEEIIKEHISGLTNLWRRRIPQHVKFT